MIPFLFLSLVASAFAGDYTIQHRGGTSIDQESIGFSGSGQNDINVTGNYTGDNDLCYEVNVTATSTIKWRASCSLGDYTTGVSMTTSAVEIEKGIFLSWDVATGHTATNTWKFKVKSVNPFKVFDAQGANLFNVQNDDDINFFNSSVTSNNAFLGLKVTDDAGSTYVKFNRTRVELQDTVYSIVATDSGKHFITAAGAVSYTLPTAKSGLWYKFTVGSGGGDITIVESGGDTISCGASSSGVSISAPTASDSIILEAIDGSIWQCSSPIPTIADWTFN